MKIVFAVWKLTDDIREMVRKLADYIANQLTQDFDYEILDVATYEVSNELDEPCFALGELAYKTISATHSWKLPAPKKLTKNTQNIQHRKHALQIVDNACRQISRADSARQLKPPTTHIETPVGVTVGQVDTDIQITPEELEYIQQLKQLLAGSKIIIQKGDLRIEIE